MARQRQKLRTTASTNVVVDIKPGPASPAQKQAWKRFWRKLISEVKADEPSRQACISDANSDLEEKMTGEGE